MKKLLSLVLVVLMVFSLAAPAFAAIGDEIPSDKSYIWISNGEIDPETMLVTVTVNVDNNSAIGFQGLDLAIYYPNCLEMVSRDYGTISTEQDIVFGKMNQTSIRNNITKYALECADNADIIEKYGINVGSADTAGNWYTYPHTYVYQRFEEDAEYPLKNIQESGTTEVITFKYIPEKNVQGYTQIPIIGLGDVLHDMNDEFPGETFVMSDFYTEDYTIPSAIVPEAFVKVPEPEAPAVPTFSVADAEAAQGQNSVMMDVSIENNPGLAGFVLFFAHDASIALNNIVTTKGEALGWDFMSNDAYNVPFETAANKGGVFAGLADKFAAQGIPTDNIVVSATSGISADSENDVISSDGAIAQLDIDASNLAPGEYNIWVAYDPGSTVDGNVNEVEFEVVAGKLTVAACAHQWVAGETVPPTCTEAGYTPYTCSLCNATKNDDFVDALGHTEGEPVIVEATCTEDGSKTVSCTVCEEVISTEVLKATGHTPGEPVIVEATCTENGSKTVSCTVCEAVISTEVLEATGHTTVNKVITYPTSTEEGSYVKYCTVCETESEPIVLDKIDKFWMGLQTTEMTVRPGKTVTIPVYVSVPSTGVWGTVISTIWDEELSNVTLANGDTFREFNVGAAKAMTEADVEKLAQYGITLSTGGKMISNVSVFPTGADQSNVYGGSTAYTITFTAPAEEGTYEIGYAVADDILGNIWEPDGYHYTYEMDDRLSLATITVEACKHVETTITTVKPTCTEPGSKTETCNECGEVVSTEVIAATGHTEGDPVVTIAPTCTEKGVETIYCKVCNEVVRTEEIEATGHKPGEAVIVKATCTENGSKTVSCTECGEVLSTEVLPATGHDTYKEEPVAPTCTEEGYTLERCRNCDYSKKIDIVDALGHKPGEAKVEKEATTTEEGRIVVRCTECKEILESEVIPKLPSGWVFEGGKWYYYDKATGEKLTNQWMADSVGWCWLTEDGSQAINTWVLDNTGWCFIGATGYWNEALKGWIHDGYDWAYIGSNSRRMFSAWLLDSIGWCYVSADGYLLRNAWVMDSQGWCYVGADGYYLRNAWMLDSHGWCYLDSEGRMATNRWILDSVGWCYVGADGYCLTNAWMCDSIGWCYLDANGRMVYNTYIQDSHGYAYIDASGYWNGKYM